jgi:type VI protein secretion system component Hcp
VAEEAMRAAINEATKQGDQQRLKALKAAAKKKTSKRKFAKWISHRDGGGGPRRFPLDFQEFSFTRQMDLASTALFEACCNSYTLKKAVLLKRKSTGDGLTMGYLRLDFTDILITSLDWDVDDTVQENIKFICRGVEVKYRRQLNTGRLGESESRSWSARDETY